MKTFRYTMLASFLVAMLLATSGCALFEYKKYQEDGVRSTEFNILLLPLYRSQCQVEAMVPVPMMAKMEMKKQMGPGAKPCPMMGKPGCPMGGQKKMMRPGSGAGMKAKCGDKAAMAKCDGKGPKPQRKGDRVPAKCEDLPSPCGPKMKKQCD